MGLSHGVAVIPNPPKERYLCDKTGAHFRFIDMCERLDVLFKVRKLKWKGDDEDFSKFS